ncbi:molybdopterin converting factor small subunit [Povalibacter uvarum]|uniref:Molybdopterin converting factor small subunit n=1 Tax=Povalibacter uvarum TaxID=732238 RepID=A0A841HRL8_9GAMM|nr:DUF3465 domain-containing protein [Povalibacter uvarum]MBB6095294.1 molybdopterin converting factor small subunit [Povalibacter uvarum]
MKKLLLALIVVAAAYQFTMRGGLPQPSTQPSSPAVAVESSADDILAQAYENQRSNIQVRGHGTVQKILSDDNQGSRHQRFLIRLGSGQTLLVAHNIDLAPRIDSLREGDRVAFFGEYEWNNKGGVLHWTHRDPQGRHAHGWLEHDGRRYE